MKILHHWKTGLVAGLFFPMLAYATTFGPIPVVQQAQNSQYYVRGRVLSGPETRMEQRLGRPYTHWTVQIQDQPLGEAIGNVIDVRQPGGEVGDMGYRVAGTAELVPGEDVFLALHDTDEGPGIKEVVGLASGKYRVESGKDGKPVVISGLGLPVTGEGGRLLSPDEFSALLRRVAQKESTDADKNVFVTRTTTHEKQETGNADAQALHTAPEQARRPAESGQSSSDRAAPEPPKSPAPGTNPVQPQERPAEEPSTGSSSFGWMIAAGVLLGLVIGLFFALRR